MSFPHAPPNKSLDASGGSVLLNLLGAAEGALIRAAASTQPFDGFLMRRLLPVLIVLFALSTAACSYSTDFVVVNDSGQPIEVRYRIKRFPNEPSTLTARPAKIASSEITTRDKRAWRNLTPDEY